MIIGAKQYQILVAIAHGRRDELRSSWTAFGSGDNMTHLSQNDHAGVLEDGCEGEITARAAARRTPPEKADRARVDFASRCRTLQA